MNDVSNLVGDTTTATLLSQVAGEAAATTASDNIKSASEILTEDGAAGAKMAPPKTDDDIAAGIISPSLGTPDAGLGYNDDGSADTQTLEWGTDIHGASGNSSTAHSSSILRFGAATDGVSKGSSRRLTEKKRRLMATRAKKKKQLRHLPGRPPIIRRRLQRRAAEVSFRTADRRREQWRKTKKIIDIRRNASHPNATALQKEVRLIAFFLAVLVGNLVYVILDRL